MKTHCIYESLARLLDADLVSAFALEYRFAPETIEEDQGLSG